MAISCSGMSGISFYINTLTKPSNSCLLYNNKDILTTQTGYSNKIIEKRVLNFMPL